MFTVLNSSAWPRANWLFPTRTSCLRPAMQVGVNAADALLTGLKIRPAVVDFRSNSRNDASPQIGNGKSASVYKSSPLGRVTGYADKRFPQPSDVRDADYAAQ